MPNQSLSLPAAQALRAGAESMVRQNDDGVLPAEVFVMLFRQAIDSAVTVLTEAGIDETSIWSNYRTALNVIVQTTLDVDTDKQAIAA